MKENTQMFSKEVVLAVAVSGPVDAVFWCFEPGGLVRWSVLRSL